MPRSYELERFYNKKPDRAILSSNQLIAQFAQLQNLSPIQEEKKLLGLRDSALNRDKTNTIGLAFFAIPNKKYSFESLRRYLPFKVAANLLICPESYEKIEPILKNAGAVLSVPRGSGATALHHEHSVLAWPLTFSSTLAASLQYDAESGWGSSRSLEQQIALDTLLSILIQFLTYEKNVIDHNEAEENLAHIIMAGNLRTDFAKFIDTAKEDLSSDKNRDLDKETSRSTFGKSARKIFGNSADSINSTRIPISNERILFLETVLRKVESLEADGSESGLDIWTSVKNFSTNSGMRFKLIIDISGKTPPEEASQAVGDLKEKLPEDVTFVVFSAPEAASKISEDVGLELKEVVWQEGDLYKLIKNMMKVVFGNRDISLSWFQTANEITSGDSIDDYLIKNCGNSPKKLMELFRLTIDIWQKRAGDDIKKGVELSIADAKKAVALHAVLRDSGTDQQN